MMAGVVSQSHLQLKKALPSRRRLRLLRPRAAHLDVIFLRLASAAPSTSLRDSHPAAPTSGRIGDPGFRACGPQANH
jgi:hypothetical protein